MTIHDMIFVVRENYFVVGIPAETAKRDVMRSNFCRAYHIIRLEKYEKLATMPSSCTFGGCSNEDCNGV